MIILTSLVLSFIIVYSISYYRNRNTLDRLINLMLFSINEMELVVKKGTVISFEDYSRLGKCIDKCEELVQKYGRIHEKLLVIKMKCVYNKLEFKGGQDECEVVFIGDMAHMTTDKLVSHLKGIIEYLKYCLYKNKEVDRVLYDSIKEYLGLADNVPAECEDDKVLLSAFGEAKALFLQIKVPKPH